MRESWENNFFYTERVSWLYNSMEFYLIRHRTHRQLRATKVDKLFALKLHRHSKKSFNSTPHYNRILLLFHSFYRVLVTWHGFYELHKNNLAYNTPTLLLKGLGTLLIINIYRSCYNFLTTSVDRHLTCIL